MARYALTVRAVAPNPGGGVTPVRAVITCNNREILDQYGCPDTSGRVVLNLHPGQYFVEARNDRSSHARFVSITNANKTIRLPLT